jgi:hypothetical protein
MVSEDDLRLAAASVQGTGVKNTLARVTALLRRACGLPTAWSTAQLAGTTSRCGLRPPLGRSLLRSYDHGGSELFARAAAGLSSMCFRAEDRGAK